MYIVMIWMWLRLLQGSCAESPMRYKKEVLERLQLNPGHLEE